MIKKHSHSIVALIAVILASLINLELYTAIIVSTFYFAREHTQAEYRIIKSEYDNKRSNMPFYGGFLPKAWNCDSLVNDAVIPMIVSFIVVLISGMI